MKSHGERVEMVRNFAKSNKLFSIIAIILVVYIAVNIITNRSAGKAVQQSTTVTSQSEVISEDTTQYSDEADSVTTTQINSEFDDETREIGYNQKKHFRFHWLDLYILICGGGFCVYKIFQERKKVREKL